MYSINSTKIIQEIIDTHRKNSEKGVYTKLNSGFLLSSIQIAVLFFTSPFLVIIKHKNDYPIS